MAFFFIRSQKILAFCNDNIAFYTEFARTERGPGAARYHADTAHTHTKRTSTAKSETPAKGHSCFLDLEDAAPAPENDGESRHDGHQHEAREAEEQQTR